MNVISKNIVDCLILILLLLLLTISRSRVSEANVVLQQKKDSLLHVLSKLDKPNEKIETLQILATLSAGKQDEVTYWKQVIEVANEADSLDCCYRAMSAIGKYYAIKEDVDSLVFWANKLDSIGKKDSRAVEYQFQVYNYLCRVYMSSSKDFKLESAMNIAISQRLLAEKTGSTKGMILSSENLGLIYMFSGRYEDAVLNMETCLSLLNKEDDQLRYKLQVAESLVRIYIYQSEFIKAEHLLDYYEEILIKIESSMNFENYDARYSRCFLYSYKIWMYSLQGKNEEAVEAIQKQELYKDALRGFAWAINKFAMGHYFFMVKKYDQALSELQPIEEGDDEVLRLKIQILKAKGDNKAVLETSQQLLEIYKEKNLNAYLSQVDQLHSLQQLNEREKQELVLLTQKRELRNKQILLVLLIASSVILAILLIFLIRYSLNTHRLRNVLEREKEFLNDINRNLEMAREKAEKADRMKSNFIANISHEIRTPLNAIVGFTGLLADSSEEERVEYIQIINNNSDLLLNLVSDVLDLSRLEAVNFSLCYQDVDIHACCLHALDTMRHRVNPGVKVIFTYSEAPYFMRTDPLRLQQLLVNLLINAAKFTEEGEIRLDYKVDVINKRICFSVSDTGCGIPLDKQKIIFDRFEKVNDFKQGAGLGLPICKAISTRFGGEVYIDASYTAGACFVFILPLFKEQ